VHPIAAPAAVCISRHRGVVSGSWAVGAKARSSPPLYPICSFNDWSNLALCCSGRYVGLWKKKGEGRGAKVDPPTPSFWGNGPLVDLLGAAAGLTLAWACAWRGISRAAGNKPGFSPIILMHDYCVFRTFWLGAPAWLEAGMRVLPGQVVRTAYAGIGRIVGAGCRGISSGAQSGGGPSGRSAAVKTPAARGPDAGRFCRLGQRVVPMVFSCRKQGGCVAESSVFPGQKQSKPDLGDVTAPGRWLRPSRLCDPVAVFRCPRARPRSGRWSCRRLFTQTLSPARFGESVAPGRFYSACNLSSILPPLTDPGATTTFDHSRYDLLARTFRGPEPSSHPHRA